MSRRLGQRALVRLQHLGLEMPGVEKVLPVTWVRQATTYYCGPAVAHMFLKRFSIDASQQDLWNDIKRNTGGRRPKGAPVENTDPEFDTQLCINCSQARPPAWTCWNTSPEALQKTLRVRAPHVGMKVQYLRTANDGMEHLVQTIDHGDGIPALATETSQHHWVAVSGYMRDDRTSTEFPAQQVGKFLLNGLYVVDSNGATESDRFGFKTVNAWRQDFGAIGCAKHTQNNRYPVIVARAGKRPGPGRPSRKQPRARYPRPK